MMNSIDIRLLGFEPDDKRVAAASMQAFREIESMWQCGTIDDLEFVRLGKELWLGQWNVSSLLLEKTHLTYT